MTDKIDQLVQKATDGHQKGGRKCTVCSTLTGDAAELMRRLDARERENPGCVNRAEVSRILRGLGHDIADSTVGSHFRREHHLLEERL